MRWWIVLRNILNGVLHYFNSYPDFLYTISLEILYICRLQKTTELGPETVYLFLFFFLSDTGSYFPLSHWKEKVILYQLYQGDWLTSWNGAGIHISVCPTGGSRRRDATGGSWSLSPFLGHPTSGSCCHCRTKNRLFLSPTSGIIPPPVGDGCPTSGVGDLCPTVGIDKSHRHRWGTKFLNIIHHKNSIHIAARDLSE